MIRINLLPHRELKRKAKQQQFSVFAAITCLLGIMTVWGVHVVIADSLDNQNARNTYLNEQITILDGQIAEINQIKARNRELLQRKNIVEELQASRNKSVHLFDQLIRLLPEGIYLNQVKQQNNTINITGYAQSSAWVSTLMRNFESSDWFESPLLIEIKAVNIDDSRLNEFNLNVNLVQSSDYDEIQ